MCPLALTERFGANTDLYKIELLRELSDLIGRLVIDWGNATRQWIQYAYNRERPVLEIRTAVKEIDFPGYLSLITRLSDLETMPSNWKLLLGAAQGVYLLTCPRTKEQYVGSAYGSDGFLGRWRHYFQGGHGGNLGLKGRESDYQVSILEVAGSRASLQDIVQMEALWKSKLQTREMGLNRN